MLACVLARAVRMNRYMASSSSHLGSCLQRTTTPTLLPRGILGAARATTPLARRLGTCSSGSAAWSCSRGTPFCGPGNSPCNEACASCAVATNAGGRAEGATSVGEPGGGVWTRAVQIGVRHTTRPAWAYVATRHPPSLSRAFRVLSSEIFTRARSAARACRATATRSFDTWPRSSRCAASCSTAATRLRLPASTWRSIRSTGRRAADAAASCRSCRLAIAILAWSLLPEAPGPTFASIRTPTLWASISAKSAPRCCDERDFAVHAIAHPPTLAP